MQVSESDHDEWPRRRATTLFIAVANCGGFRRLVASAPMDERAASLLCEYFPIFQVSHATSWCHVMVPRHTDTSEYFPIFQRGCSPEDAVSAVLAEFETAVTTLATVREVRLQVHRARVRVVERRGGARGCVWLTILLTTLQDPCRGRGGA